jgi:hypothetical protein
MKVNVSKMFKKKCLPIVGGIIPVPAPPPWTYPPGSVGTGKKFPPWFIT